jgi:hypothetical protein
MSTSGSTSPAQFTAVPKSVPLPHRRPKEPWLHALPARMTTHRGRQEKKRRDILAEDGGLFDGGFHGMTGWLKNGRNVVWETVKNAVNGPHKPPSYSHSTQEMRLSAFCLWNRARASKNWQRNK